jgi:hypothetical protein
MRQEDFDGADFGDRSRESLSVKRFIEGEDGSKTILLPLHTASPCPLTSGLDGHAMRPLLADYRR